MDSAAGKTHCAPRIPSRPHGPAMIVYRHRARPSGNHRRCARLLVALAALVACPGPAAAPEPVTSLRALRQAVQSQQRAVRPVRIEAVVCAADPERGLLALRDETGAEVLAGDLAGRVFTPGERLRLTITNGAILRRQWTLALDTPPVVDNGGVHATATATGRVQLAAGLHPLRLHYFNVENPAALEVRYAGPGVPPQLIPDAVLFREWQTNGTHPGGLDFACYGDTPATLDRLHNLVPVFRGVVANFDISQRRPETDVAMLFRGLLRIEQPGEYEFIVSSDDGSELYLGRLPLEFTPVGQGPPPTPVRAWSPARPPAEHGEWRTLEGMVSFAGQSRNGLELVLQHPPQSTRLWLAGHENFPPGLLLNARLQATGVHRRAHALSADHEAGLMVVLRPGDFHLQAVAPELWRRNPPVTVARARAGAGATGVIVHLRGEVAGVNPDGPFHLRDDTGTIPVHPSGASLPAPGATIAVLGVALGDGEPRVTTAIWRPAQSEPDAPQILTTAAQVQQLSTREAARQHPVTVRGVITCLVEWGGAVVQDATRGVFFSFDPAYRDGLEPGDFAEIQGETAAGDFAPIIAARTIRVLGSGPMPEPVRPTWNQLLSGSLDAQYAEVRGLVTEVVGNRVTLMTENGKIRVVLHDLGESARRRLLNTLVRIRGCLLAVWDSETRQVRVGEIRFRNPAVEIEQLPLADPFAVPEKTIADLLRFDFNASGFERVKVVGQIIHARAGELFLQQGEHGLRFRRPPEAPWEPGDIVEVVGIPDVSGPSPRLHEAVARKTGVAPLPPALPWATAEQTGQNLDGLRVSTSARLIGIHFTGLEWVLQLQAGLREFQARLPSPEDWATRLPLGSRVEVAGVCAAIEGDHGGEPAGIELLLSSGADLTLVQRPPWWTLRRLLIIVASLAAGLGIAAIWITQLRRQVALRTAQLEREHARRERAERERALEIERSRIARDLHDDLGSSLTEIRVLASRGLRQRADDAGTPTLFQAITEKARALIGALDVIVWAVNPEANTLQSLADYLSSYAEEYLDTAGIACRFRIPVALPARQVDGQLRHDLFLAVKEALHNIVRHSHATEVEFHLEADPTRLRILILDNGRGFNPDGPSGEGHGLRNLPERLARMGGSCEVRSRPGAGTRVSISVPLPAESATEAGP